MRARKQQPVSLSGEETLASVLARARRLLGRHGGSILIGAVAVLVVLFGYRGYRSKALSEQAESWQALAALPSVQHEFLTPEANEKLLTQIIQGCRGILDTRWKTDATPWVMLRLASAQRSAGLYQDALETCSRLAKEYSSHYAAGVAAESRAGLLEETGQYKEAALAYEALARLHREGSPYWPDVGRNWELAGDREAAIHAYEMVADKEGFVISASRLKSLKAGKPLLVAPPPPPPPAPSAEGVPPGEHAEPGQGSTEGGTNGTPLQPSAPSAEEVPPGEHAEPGQEPTEGGTNGTPLQP